jgi:SAM-dependent methyltransferase
VLEIGCGQGDMTAALANAVGATGQVVAVDLADPSYGAPATLGQSAEQLLASPLGPRIEFQFEFDVLDAANVFLNDSFDFVVLAHCTWYFASIDQLAKTLGRVWPWAKRLCLSEWDLQPRSVDQLGHLLAVLIQGQVECFKPTSQSNVRTPYSVETLKSLLVQTGWETVTESLLDTTDLEDGRWEIGMCLRNSVREADELKVPDKFCQWLVSQTDILARLEKDQGAKSLSSYSVVASRMK